MEQKKLSDFLEKSIKDDIFLRWIIILIGGIFLILFVYFFNKKYLFPSVILILSAILLNVIINQNFLFFLKKPVLYSYITGLSDVIIATFAIFFTGGFKSPLYLLYFIILLDCAFEYWSRGIFIHLTLISFISYLFVFILSSNGKFLSNEILEFSIRSFFIIFSSIVFYFISKGFGEQYKKLIELNEEKEKMHKELIDINKNLEEKIKNAVEKLEKSNMLLVKKNITLLAAHEIYKSSSEIQSKELLLDLVLNTLIPLLKGNGGIVLSVSRDLKTVKVENIKRFTDNLGVEVNTELDLDPNSRLFSIINNKRAIICESIESIEDTLLNKILKEGSCIATPLLRHGKVKNILIVFNKKQNIYTRSDIELIEILGEQISILLYSRELFDETRKRAETLEKLIDVTLNIEKILNENEIIKTTLNESVEKIFPNSAGVIIIQNESNILKIKAQVGFSSDIVDKEIARESVCGWVCKNNKNINIKNINEVEIFNPEYDRFYLKRYSIGAPIHIKDRVIGAIFITKDSEHFRRDDINFLNIISNYMSRSIENARLYNNIRQDYLNTIYALATAVDAKDHYTHGHSTTVMKYSVKIAEAIGLPEDEVETIKYAALLHDIGKIGISENILNKPSKLTKEEYAIIKMHPQLGANIVSKIDSLKKLTTLILSHHEWINGNGYPLGLRGDEIPLGARIISIADAFSTMTSKRPYRDTMGIDYAISELRKYAGIQFDKDLVEVFIKILEKEQRKEETEKSKDKKRIRIKLEEDKEKAKDIEEDEKFYS